MKSEQQLRAEHESAQIKIEALDWLKEKGGDTTHKDSCNYLDDTGYPAPCSCGLRERTRVQNFLRNLVLAN